MSENGKKLLVVQAAALGYDFAHGRMPDLDLAFHPAEAPSPGLTCTVQASFRTAAPPADHGMVANGLYHRTLRRPLFWEQSSAQVAGPRIWDTWRETGKTVALLFWQQSLGESADMILSPAPIHKHHGGMIQSVYSKPSNLYTDVCQSMGRPFALKHYWGPLASTRSSDWIAEATAAVISNPSFAPDLCLTYLPALDYDLQRFGPSHARSDRALEALKNELSLLSNAARSNNYDMLVYGDYAIGACQNGAVLPNLALHDAGLFATRCVGGRLYPDFHESRAFAMVDHEIAHVYTRDQADRDDAHALLAGLEGIGEVLDTHAAGARGIAHENSGDLVITADDGYWFAYPWWTDPGQAPDFATHIDIHNKPGYDPCELFFGRIPWAVSQDTDRVRGSHGRTGDNRRVLWGATPFLSEQPNSLLDLSAAVRDWLTSS